MVTLMPREESWSLSSVVWSWPCQFSFLCLYARLGDILERSIRFRNSNAMGARIAAVRIGVRAALLLRWQGILVIMPHMVRDAAVRRGCLLVILPLYNILGLLIILCSSDQTWRNWKILCCLLYINIFYLSLSLRVPAFTLASCEESNASQEDFRPS